MKQALRLSILPLLIASGFFFNGCASILPGHDAVVVRAEQTISISTDAFDTFLKSEDQTHVTFCSVSPEGCRAAHSFAEFLKAKVPDHDPLGNPTEVRRAKQYLNSAIHLTEVYKENRTAENKRNLQTILATITAAVAEAQKYLVQFRALKGP